MADFVREDLYKNSADHDKEPDRKTDHTASDTVFNTTVFAVDFTKGLKKFWYIVVIFAILMGAIAGYWKHTSYVPMYQSSVSFSVSAVTYTTNGSASFASYYDNASASQLSKTFPYIINTSMMRNALQSELGADGINGTISAEAVVGDTNIFKVSVSSNSPEDAYAIVNAVIKVYPEVSRFVIGNVRLNILIKPSLPTEPYTSSNIVRTVSIAVLIGAVLGFGVIALYAFFRNTVRRKEDFKNKLNQKCLVEVPYVVIHRKSSDKKHSNTILRITGKHPMFKESFRLLRKRLLKHLGKEEKVIAVASAAENEGKTTIALNLAHALAIAGHKTALVDMDLLRKPLQKYFETDPQKTGFLDLIQKGSEKFSRAAFQEDENLFLYFAGKAQIKFTENQFLRFFRYLRSQYDYIIVNTSPGGGYVSDAVAVCNLCDSLIFVVKQDSASIDKIRKTLEYLSFSTAKIQGFVFNGVQEGFSGYGGYYYGGKYGYGKYGYGKYGYGRYGYGRYGYGHYGYGSDGYGYGYGYGYGEEPEDGSPRSHKKSSEKAKSKKQDSGANSPLSEIPDNNA